MQAIQPPADNLILEMLDAMIAGKAGPLNDRLNGQIADGTISETNRKASDALFALTEKLSHAKMFKDSPIIGEAERTELLKELRDQISKDLSTEQWKNLNPESKVEYATAVVIAGTDRLVDASAEMQANATADRLEQNKAVQPFLRKLVELGNADKQADLDRIPESPEAQAYKKTLTKPGSVVGKFSPETADKIVEIYTDMARSDANKRGSDPLGRDLVFLKKELKIVELDQALIESEATYVKAARDKGIPAEQAMQEAKILKDIAAAKVHNQPKYNDPKHKDYKPEYAEGEFYDMRGLGEPKKSFDATVEAEQEAVKKLKEETQKLLPPPQLAQSTPDGKRSLPASLASLPLKALDAIKNPPPAAATGSTVTADESQRVRIPEGRQIAGIMKAKPTGVAIYSPSN